MWKFISDNLKEFRRGAFAFGFTSFSFISFQKIIVLDYIWGLVTVVVSGALGGMATALGTYYFKHKLQNKLFKSKRKKDGKNPAEIEDCEKVA